jgi:hypothetical protein
MGSMSRGPTVKYRRRGAAPELEARTTLSSAARGVDVQPAASWTRRHLLYGAIGIAAGSTSGAVLALRSVEAGTPAPATHVAVTPTSTATAPSPHPVVTPLPPAAATPNPGDAHAVLVVQIKDVLARFLAWSTDHPDGRCPDPTTLGVSALDPWGQGLRIICRDQPAEQIVGVLSYGPDGTPGTPDDVMSWTLGPEVTDLVRGPRWGSTHGASAGARGKRRSVSQQPEAAAASTRPSTGTNAPSPPAPTPTAVHPAARSHAGTGSGSNPSDGEGIPDRR